MIRSKFYYLSANGGGGLPRPGFSGVGIRGKFVSQIGKLLLASEVVYAGHGYCVALALIGGEECISFLRNYLNQYLPLNGRFYDQDWALGALTYVEGRAPPEYLLPELWQDGDRHSMC